MLEESTPKKIVEDFVSILMNLVQSQSDLTFNETITVKVKLLSKRHTDYKKVRNRGKRSFAGALDNDQKMSSILLDTFMIPIRNGFCGFPNFFVNICLVIAGIAGSIISLTENNIGQYKGLSQDLRSLKSDPTSKSYETACQKVKQIYEKLSITYPQLKRENNPWDIEEILKLIGKHYDVNFHVHELKNGKDFISHVIPKILDVSRPIVHLFYEKTSEMFGHVSIIGDFKKKVL